MVTFELEQFAITANKIWQKAREENRLTHNPSAEELRGLVEKQPGVRKTVYGNFVAKVSLLLGQQCSPKTVLTTPLVRMN